MSKQRQQLLTEEQRQAIYCLVLRFNQNGIKAKADDFLSMLDHLDERELSRSLISKLGLDIQKTGV